MRRTAPRFLTLVDRYFAIEAKGSSFQTEILAGLSTFLSLSYIFVVNPAILAQAGMNKSAVLFATIITSGIATILMGLWARLPFALAPGMEMNAYVAFFVVGTFGFSWQQALGAVFWSGVVFIILSVTRVRQNIIEAIPEQMKSALSLSVGVFLALVALKISGILRYEGVHISGVGRLWTVEAAALLMSLVLVLVFTRLRIAGAVMIAIVLTSAFCNFLGVGVGERAATLSLEMLSGIGEMAPGVILNPRILSVILILFLIDFYGSVAKLIGLSAQTNILESGKLPHIREALLIDSASTVAGAALGTSSITVYVESAIGIGAGGRTGLTAVVCGLLMLACFALAPVLHYIPVIATSGALIFVAITLCPSIADLKSLGWIDISAMITMQLLVVATFALDRAMLAGFAVYALASFVTTRRINIYLSMSILLLAIGVWLQKR